MITDRQKLGLGIVALIGTVTAAVWWTHRADENEPEYVLKATPNSYYQENTRLLGDVQHQDEQSLSTLVPEGSNNSVSDPRFMSIFVG